MSWRGVVVLLGLLAAAPLMAGETDATAAARPRADAARTETTDATQAERSASGAPDRLELDASSIRGNQELPRVMYIVPWKDPGLGDLAGRPVNSLVEEALAPVDREVFLRQTRYFDQLYGAESDGGP